jgi:hypothetical protein
VLDRRGRPERPVHNAIGGETYQRRRDPYREAEFSMVRACGSPPCRWIITGDDWRRPELRERCGDHWVPAVLTVIHAIG